MDSELAQFVRDTYSRDGVEVEGIGANRTRLRMPPDFHDVTGLCRELLTVFGACVDLSIDDSEGKCVVFEVFQPIDSTNSRDFHTPTPSPDPLTEEAAPRPPTQAPKPEGYFMALFYRFLLPIFVAIVAYLILPKVTAFIVTKVMQNE